MQDETRFEYLTRMFGIEYAKARFESPGYCVNTLPEYLKANPGNRAQRRKKQSEDRKHV